MVGKFGYRWMGFLLGQDWPMTVWPERAEAVRLKINSEVVTTADASSAIHLQVTDLGQIVSPP